MFLKEALSIEMLLLEKKIFSRNRTVRKSKVELFEEKQKHTINEEEEPKNK